MEWQEHDREEWRREWRYCIGRFADFPTQQAQWLDAQEPNPHRTFIEVMCCYFDDLLRGEPDYGWAVAAGLVSRQEAETVQPFHVRAASYRSPTNDFDHAAILRDPAWQAVTEAAMFALAALPPDPVRG